MSLKAPGCRPTSPTHESAGIEELKATLIRQPPPAQLAKTQTSQLRPETYRTAPHGFIAHRRICVAESSWMPAYWEPVGQNGTFGWDGCITRQTTIQRKSLSPPHVQIEDCELIRRTLDGDTDGFRMLVERHQSSVFRFAFSLLGSREDAQDIAQDSFLAAYRALAGFDSSRARFSTWLLTITRNRCINQLKKRRSVSVESWDFLTSRTTPNAISQQELFHQLDCALARLPVKQRTAFVLAEIEEYPYDEIARIENTTLGTVKSRIHRAKQKLQSLLDAPGTSLP